MKFALFAAWTKKANKIKSMKENKRVAVFIDAENISAKYAARLIEEAANYGDVIVRRVFADWSSPNVQAWKETVARHSLIAEQQFSAVKGKNSGDISLIINAMVVLFEKDIDVFCLASSDSDFTRLVQELREREKTVVGFGLKQTAQAFVNAFSEFIYLDSESEKEKTAKKHEAVQTEILDESRRAALKEIIEKLIEEDGWALYARIAIEMKNKFADFVPKNYNCRSMKELIGKVIDSIGNYEIGTGKDGTTMFLIPAAENKKSKAEKTDELPELKSGATIKTSASGKKQTVKKGVKSSSFTAKNDSRKNAPVKKHRGTKRFGSGEHY